MERLDLTTIEEWPLCLRGSFSHLIDLSLDS